MTDSTVRLRPIPPAELSDEQKPLYEDMKKGISSDFNAFQTMVQDGPAKGALIGPWNPWLHEPKIGRAIWDLTEAMTAEASLPEPVRQVVILVVGAQFDAAYELYAHIAVAEKVGMDDARLASLCSGIKPADLSAEESAGYDVAFALVNGGTLPRPAWDQAVALFGQHGANEMIYLVGLYCMVSTTLNGFAVGVPEDA